MSLTCIEGLCKCKDGFTGNKCDSCDLGFIGDRCDKCASGYYGPKCTGNLILN